MDKAEVAELPFSELYWRSHLRRGPEQALGADLMRHLATVSKRPGVTNEATVMAAMQGMGVVAMLRFMRYISSGAGASTLYADLHVRRFKRNGGVYYRFADELAKDLAQKPFNQDTRCGSIRSPQPNIYVMFGGVERPGLGLLTDNGGSARLEGVLVSETVTNAALEDSLKPDVGVSKEALGALSMQTLLPKGFPKDRDYRVLEFTYTAVRMVNGMPDNADRYICGANTLRMTDETQPFMDVVRATDSAVDERTALLKGAHDPSAQFAMGVLEAVDSKAVHGTERLLATTLEVAKALHFLGTPGCVLSEIHISNVDMPAFQVSNGG